MGNTDLTNKLILSDAPEIVSLRIGSRMRLGDQRQGQMLDRAAFMAYTSSYGEVTMPRNEGPDECGGSRQYQSYSR